MSEHNQASATAYSFDNGKYTVVNDNGILTALRYNEPWRSLAGDNLVAAMLDEVNRLFDALSLTHKTATDQEAELQRLHAENTNLLELLHRALPMVVVAYSRNFVDAEAIGRDIEEVLNINQEKTS
jgi:hypothetical protein